MNQHMQALWLELTAPFRLFRFSSYTSAPVQQTPPAKKSGGTFDNPVTGTIAMIIVTLFILAAIIIWMGSLWGIPPLCFAIGMVWSGWKDHGFISSAKKDEAGIAPEMVGLLLYRGQPIMWQGDCVTVNKTVILAPWFWITSILVNMTPEEISFPVDCVSVDNVQIPLNLSIVCEIIPAQMSDFMRYGNGKWDRIKKDIQGIVSEETEEVSSQMKVVLMAQRGRVVSNKLDEFLTGAIQNKGFGIKVNQIRVSCVVPKPLADKMQSVQEAIYEANARVETVNGVHRAKEQEMKLNPGISPDQAHRNVIEAMLLEDGSLERFQWEIIGDAQNINVYGARFESGHKDNNKGGSK